MKINERNNYNVLSYQFTCLHECFEWKWHICVHCRSRNKCVDHIRPVYLSEEGIYHPTEKVEISLQHFQDLGFYVHEFTETSISDILRRFRKDWNASVKFKGYGDTYITHFISLYGNNHGRCLSPVTRYNLPRW
jgi:hypothetical protein